MRELAELTLTVLAVAEAAGMAAVELNRTHATNPMWTGHARFHLVWQILTTAFLAIFVCALLWWPHHDETGRFILAAFLCSIPLVGFLAAHVTRRLYGGSLSDPNGVPPIRIRSAKGIREVDGNTAAVAVGFVTLCVAILLFISR